MAQSQAELPPEDHQAALVGSHQPAKISIREHLRRWQEQLPSAESGEVMMDVLGDRGEPGATRNIITRPQDGDRLSDVSEGRDGDNSDIMSVVNLRDQVPDIAESLPFLQQGDMVELMLGPQTLKHSRSWADYVQWRFRAHSCNLYPGT